LSVQITGQPQRRQHKGLNNRAQIHTSYRIFEIVTRRFTSPCRRQRFDSIHDQVLNLLMHRGYNTNAQQSLTYPEAVAAWEMVRCVLSNSA